MIDFELFEKVIKETDLDGNEFIYLCFLSNGGNLSFLDGIRNKVELQLVLKGYLYSTGDFTPKCEKLLKSLKNTEKPVETDRYVELHKKLQDKLVTLTGKKQVKVGGKFNFLPNSMDLKEKLEKVIKKYKLTDWNRIELLLLQYIELCNTKKFDTVQLMFYYILREKPDVSSNLATDYEGFIEKETGFKSNQKFI